METVVVHVKAKISKPSNEVAQQIQNYLRAMDELLKDPVQSQKKLLKRFLEAKKRRNSYKVYANKKGIKNYL
jgi:hypothetical protein